MASWQQLFEAHAGKLLVQRQIPGISVGLAVEGAPTYTQGFGFRNREEGLPCTAETVHGIGSVTKSITAVAILQLQEGGKLSLEEPVVKYLPEFRLPDAAHAQQITIHHFLTHTSGLPPLPSLFPAMMTSIRNDPGFKNFGVAIDLEKMPAIDTHEQLMAFIAKTPLELLGPPGTRFSYCNDAYGLLGAIIERVSGQSYASFVSENILQPAGMHHSTFDIPDAAVNPDVTMLYAPKPEGEGYEASPAWWHSPAMLAAGFMRSTVLDMLRYMEIYRTGGVVDGVRILSPESVRRMTSPLVACAPNVWYGYGLMVTPAYHGVTLIEHGGSVKGVAAQVLCVPERGLTGVGIANGSGAPISQVMLGAVNAYLGLPVQTSQYGFGGTCACPAEQLRTYAGTYRSGEGTTLQVTEAGEGLSVEIQGRSCPARAVGDRTFAVLIDDGEMPITFLLDAAGRAIEAEFGFRVLKKVQA